MPGEVARQFSFRLPETLVQRVEVCMRELRATGLEVNRADVVRLLLKHALDATHCNVNQLFSSRPPAKRSRKRQD